MLFRSKAEGVTFSEYVRTLGGDHSSLSMAAARVRETDMAQGGLERTGGPFDLAIEGDGFFLVETADGERLTRAGRFTPNAEGELVTMDGRRVLDAGGAPVFVPQGAGQVAIGSDGTISVDGNPVGQVGLVVPADPLRVTREGGTLFRAEGGTLPAEGGRVLQGFLEQSNVNPIVQIGRMIEVQRAYELGQSFLEAEDERIRGAIRTVGQTS